MSHSSSHQSIDSRVQCELSSERSMFNSRLRESSRKLWSWRVRSSCGLQATQETMPLTLGQFLPHVTRTVSREGRSYRLLVYHKGPSRGKDGTPLNLTVSIKSPIHLAQVLEAYQKLGNGSNDPQAVGRRKTSASLPVFTVLRTSLVETKDFPQACQTTPAQVKRNLCRDVI